MQNIKLHSSIAVNMLRFFFKSLLEFSHMLIAVHTPRKYVETYIHIHSMSQYLLVPVTEEKNNWNLFLTSMGKYTLIL